MEPAIRRAVGSRQLTPVIPHRQGVGNATAVFFRVFRVVLYQRLMRLHLLLDADRQAASGIDGNNHGLWYGLWISRGHKSQLSAPSAGG